jgi:signal transduction histidine kinase
MESENNNVIPFANPANHKVNADGPDNEARNRDNELMALSRVAAAISGLWDLEAILKVGLNSVLEIMHGVIGGVMFLDEETRTLSYFVYQGLSAKYADEMRLKLGEGIAGKVAQDGRAILLEDISLEPSAARPDLIKTEGLKAFTSVPLRAKDKILGVMNVASSKPHRFSKRDIYLLHSIGDILGTAIEQAKLYEQLRKSRERYRELARQILIAQEEERRRIARELHDETSQTLSGLALNLQALIEMAEAAGIKNPEFKERLKKIHSLTVEASAEVGRLIANLRPTVLDTLGLIPAIRRYAETNLTPVGINVHFEMKESIKPLLQEVEIGLFRWAQGVIGNIIQHSRARNATISLRREGDEIVLCISDDGKGFNVSQLTGIDKGGRGAGLFGVKERIGLLGGTCSVQSQPGKGTTVTASIPVTWGRSNAKNKGISGRRP